MEGVIPIRTDMCRWNLRIVSDDNDNRLSLKPTGLLANSPEIAAEMDRRCVCEGEAPKHAPLLGGLAVQATKYTKEFVDQRRPERPEVAARSGWLLHGGRIRGAHRD